MTVNLESLLYDLSDKYLGNKPHELENIYLQLRDYYQVNNHHSYAELTSIIFFNQDEEDVEILTHNLDVLKEFSKEKDEDLTRKVAKLIDHAHLSILQKGLIKSTQKSLDQDLQRQIGIVHETRKENEQNFKVIEGIRLQISASNEKMTSLDERTQKFEETFEDISAKLQPMEEKIEDSIEKFEDVKTRIYTEFVVILGIFAAIIFATFGGLEILNNVLGNMKEVHSGKLLVFSSLSISGITILLFVLLSGISRLTNLNLRSCGCNSRSKDCNHNFIQKHPSIFFTNLILFYTAFIGVIEYTTNYRYMLTSFITNFSYNQPFIISSILIIVTGPLLWSFFYRFYTKNYDKSDNKIKKPLYFIFRRRKTS